MVSWAMRLTKAERDLFAKLGRKGAKARSAALSPDQRAAISKHAAQTRWAKVRAEASANKERVV